MSRILRAVVLTTALLAATTASAGAVTWHNSGDTSFTAQGGATTLHFGGVHLPCSGATVTGTTGATPFTGATWTAATGTVDFGHCTMAGQTLKVDCTYAQTLSSQTGGISAGTIDAACGIYLANTQICGVAGALASTYTNPSGGFGSFTVSTSALTLSNGPVGTCPFGTTGTLTHQTWTITSASGGPAPHTGPVITRTP
jgi:hypothetical protein